jgi:hypothetical protein
MEARETPEWLGNTGEPLKAKNGSISGKKVRFLLIPYGIQRIELVSDEIHRSTLIGTARRLVKGEQVGELRLSTGGSSG